VCFVEFELSLTLDFSLYSVCKTISCGIVRAFVDFRAINFGGAGLGAFFALNCCSIYVCCSVWNFRTSLVLLELDLDKVKGLASVTLLD
jgi:hypothetical protein